MKLSHAFGFLTVGLLLGLLTQLAPEWSRAGSGAGELWLRTMSWLQVGMAACVFASKALGVLARRMRYPGPALAGTVTAGAGRIAAATAAAAGREPRALLKRVKRRRGGARPRGRRRALAGAGGR